MSGLSGAYATAPGMQRRRVWVIGAGLIFPLTLFMSLDRIMISTAIPVIGRTYHFSLLQDSYVLSAFWFFYALAMFPSGLITQRIGSRIALAFAGLWWSVFTVLTTIASGFASFVLVRSLLGIGQAADFPATVAAVQKSFPEDARSKGIMFLTGGLYVGFLIGPLVTVGFIVTYGWQMGFYVFGLLGAIWAVLWYLFYREKAASCSQDVPSTTGAWQQVLRSGQVWSLAISYACTALVQGFFVNWLPTYLNQVRHFSLAQMGLGASAPAFGLAAAVFVAGPLSDAILRRTGSVWKARLPFGAGGLLGAAVCQVLGTIAPWPAVMLILFTLSYACLGAVNVAVFSACQDIGQGLTASVTGLTNFLGNLFVAIGPVTTAFLVSLSGNWSTAILILCIAGALGAGLWWLVKPNVVLAQANAIAQAA